MKKIIFVCLGNICRSPMAEFVMKDLLEKEGREGELKFRVLALRGSIMARICIKARKISLMLKISKPRISLVKN